MMIVLRMLIFIEDSYLKWFRATVIRGSYVNKYLDVHMDGTWGDTVFKSKGINDSSV